MSAIHKLGEGMGVESKIASIRLMPLRRPRKSGERGGTLVEFAIAMVITLVLMFAMIDFARALYSFHFISEAAREGTRFASVRGADCSASAGPCPAQPADIVTFVQQLVPQGIDSTQVTITPNWPNPNNLPMCGNPPQDYPGCTVQVTVAYNFNFIFPFNFYNLPPISFAASTITMSSTSQMVISR
jgi:Flp pilus assembly protein TadG